MGGDVTPTRKPLAYFETRRSGRSVNIHYRFQSLALASCLTP
jgi:hypothetical protein